MIRNVSLRTVQSVDVEEEKMAAGPRACKLRAAKCRESRDTLVVNNCCSMKKVEEEFANLFDKLESVTTYICINDTNVSSGVAEDIRYIKNVRRELASSR